MTNNQKISQNKLREMYFELLKKTLMHSIWYKKEHIESNFSLALKQKAPSIFGRSKGTIEEKYEGKVWPEFAHTMIGKKRLDNIQFCVESVINNEIPGDLIETGVWRGGACIFMQAILKAHNIKDRKVWVADSFEGLPKPNLDKTPYDKGDKHFKYKELAISIEEVKENFSAYDMLDENVIFLKGWFKDTLPNANIKKLAICRLDGDMYESTIDAISVLYPKLSIGGYLIIDDYGAVEGCKKAIHDYRKSQNITEEIIEIDWGGAYWKKTK